MRSPPGDMPAGAQSVWREVVVAHTCDWFDRTDPNLLAAYCTAVALYRQAVRGLAEDGVILLSAANVPGPSPWLTIHDKQSTLVAKLGSQLKIGSGLLEDG